MIGDAGEKFGDWGLKISEMRSNGLNPLRPEDVGDGRRRSGRGVEYPDNPVGFGAPVCRRRPCTHPEDGLVDNNDPDVRNCVGLCLDVSDGGVDLFCRI